MYLECPEYQRGPRLWEAPFSFSSSVTRHQFADGQDQLINMTSTKPLLVSRLVMAIQPPSNVMTASLPAISASEEAAQNTHGGLPLAQFCHPRFAYQFPQMKQTLWYSTGILFRSRSIHDQSSERPASFVAICSASSPDAPAGPSVPRTLQRFVQPVLSGDVCAGPQMSKLMSMRAARARCSWLVVTSDQHYRQAA